MYLLANLVELEEEQFEVLETLMQYNVYLLTLIAFILLTILVLKR